MTQGQIEPVGLPNQRDTRSLGYKKRHGKDRRVGHKIERSIPYIRETFPHLTETILPDQVREGDMCGQPALKIDWTSVVPPESIQKLFKEDVAIITGAGTAARPVVCRIEPRETLNNLEIRPLPCKRASR